MNTIKISFLALTLGLMSFATISTISWKSETIDVGEIPQSKPKAITFEFKNTGKTDVIITNVQGSCGCTATDYTKTPIKAGKSGTVIATYNAANLGAFTKTVSVTTNADATPKVLTLKGVVKAVVVQG
ncbi:DUF1573 domain-containing protein [Flavobacterium sp.]|uniref:DUF1573 domain-containing protein n=1 Tax=Flavobacterium sp. TaxID=239 RepID=UPI00286E531C|nr:DUF1573 domain-containing protein [Flavobacterium sp.]